MTSILACSVDTRRYDRVEKGILLGALPMKKVVPDMKKEGVTHVLNMVAEWGGPTRYLPFPFVAPLQTVHMFSLTGVGISCF